MWDSTSAGIQTREYSPVPVLGLVLRPDEQPHKEQVDDNVGWQRSIGDVHVG